MPKYIDSDKLMETIKAHDYLLVAHNNSIDRGMFTAGIQQVIDESPAGAREVGTCRYWRWRLSTSALRAARHGLSMTERRRKII